MSTNISLTIIIPVYNEEKAVGTTIERLKLAVQPYNWNIVAVNDGSKDNSLSVLESISGITVINHKVNKGYGAALKTGIMAATTDYVSFYDSDGQHEPQDLINLGLHIGDADMIVGDRGKKFYSTTVRAPGKWVLRKVADSLAGTKIPDLNSGLRVVKTDKIKDVLSLCPNGFSFSTTSTLAFFNLGYLTEYYPIDVQTRVGKSSVKIFSHGFQTIMLMVRLIALFNPLKIFIPTAVYIFLLGILYQLVEFFKIGLHIVNGAVLLIITGIIIFMIGILADQVSALRLETRSFQKGDK